MPELVQEPTFGGGGSQEPPAETTFDDDGFGDQYRNMRLLQEATFGARGRVERIRGSAVQLMNFVQAPERMPRDIMPAHLLGARVMLLSDISIKDNTPLN